jgi:single-strand DNA-binding protein
MAAHLRCCLVVSSPKQKQVNQSKRRKPMNNVQLSGWLARDPEAKFFESGSCVVTNAVGVQEYKKDKDKTNFVEVKFWNKTAEFVGNHLKKGDFVMISGRLEVESWQDKQGNNRSKTVVVCQTLDTPPKPKAGATAPSGVAAEEVPF